MDNMEAIKEKIVPVLKRHNVLKAAIFGSLVKGELNSASDIDILVEIDEDKSLIEIPAASGRCLRALNDF